MLGKRTKFEFQGFLVCGFVWFLIGSGCLLFLQHSPYEKLLGFVWFLAFWALALFNLWSLHGLCRSMLRFQVGAATQFRCVVLAGLKWLGLTGWVFLLWSAQKAPLWSVVLGIATAVVVPILTGVSLKQRLLQHA